MKTREEINEILVQHTKPDIDRVSDDTERDYWMSAEASKEYGVIDEVLSRRTLQAVDG